MHTTNTMALPVNNFIALAGQRHPHAVTIYLPMDMGGRQQNQHLAQARLKQCLDKAHQDLEKWIVPAREIEKLLDPVKALLDDVDLWRNPSKGLAIFVSPEAALQYYRVPISFEQQTVIGRRFLLSPMLPLFMNDEQYYLLELSRDYVKLYIASRFQFRELNLEVNIPGQLEDVVGHDFEQKNLQYHSGGPGERTIIHGHGSGKDDKKKELIKFFRGVQEGVDKQITGSGAPLVLSCVNELFATYKEINRYPHLYMEHLKGDPEERTPTRRHQDSWELIRPYFEKTREQKREVFRESFNTPRVSLDIDEIIPAAIIGKIDTLFLASGETVFGTYDPEREVVRLDPAKQINNTSLTDLAAMNTFLRGGKVYFVSAADMPVKNTTMNAIFKF